MDYQNDVRLAVRDELPTEINAEDISESAYQQIFMSELIWPPLFFSGWAAFEPDVSCISCLYVQMLIYVICVAHLALPMGERSTLTNVQR